MNHLARLTGMFLSVVTPLGLAAFAPAQEMDALWGEDVVKLRAEDASRGQLFNDGNYAMFVHWGLYSTLANKVEGKTYYGIGEWIMNPRMAGIPVDRYQKIAAEFNPVKYDAAALAQLAKDAGMKYIVVTSKHHDGFAMYHSKANENSPLFAIERDVEFSKIAGNVVYNSTSNYGPLPPGTIVDRDLVLDPGKKPIDAKSCKPEFRGGPAGTYQPPAGR